MRVKAVGALLLVLVATSAVSFGQQPSATVEERSLRIAASREAVRAGSPVVVEVITTNNTNHPLNNSSWKNPWNNYIIDVRRVDGSPVPDTEVALRLKASVGKPGLEGRALSFGGIRFDTLQPGQQAIEQLSVSSYCDMSRPGKYTIQLTWNLADPGRPKVAGTKSNTVTITVVP